MSEATVLKVNGGLTAVAGGSSVLSFMAATLPVLQYISVLVAIMSGTAGFVWIVVQYLRSRKKND